MKYFLATVLVLCAGCAQMSTEITETMPASEGKPMTETKVTSSYLGSAAGARNLIDAEIRRRQTVDQGEIGKTAIEKGMPTTLGEDANQSNVQAGYTFGPYGMMPGMNMPGANLYGVSPGIMAGDAASRGYAPGYLPRLGEAPVYIQPSPSQVVQTTSGTGKVECPTDRVPNTTDEEVACLKINQTTTAKKVLKLERK